MLYELVPEKNMGINALRSIDTYYYLNTKINQEPNKPRIFSSAYIF